MSVELSVVIPVYNEEAILVASVDELRRGLDAEGWDWEIWLAENGSRDRTPELAAALAAADPRVKWFSCPEPNYGAALRMAIERASGRYVVCEEIDLCDLHFHRRALALLRAGAAAMVVGSKAMPGAHDRRPLLRQVATRAYNLLLRVTLGYRGTDTHGLKAFRRDALLPVVGRCIVGHDVFASELVIRAQREGVPIVEIPVELAEKRAPSIHLARRVPRVLKNLARLTAAIHFGRGAEERR
ncbi:MAG TPA: glycosyltransferase [Nannocystis sp.]